VAISRTIRFTRTQWLTALILLTLALAGNGAAGPETTDVFVSGTDGYHTYRIPALIVTRDGTVLAFCEGRKKGGGDSGDIDMLVKRSTDGGSTWGAQQVLWSDGENTCGNPAPVVDQASGVVWLLMTWNLGTDHEKEIQAGTARDTRRVFVTHSTDDGQTWTAPREITSDVKKPDWGWYATGPVNGIQLVRGENAGRIVIPCNHSAPRAAGGSVTRSHIVYSDNHGTTWRLGGVEDDLTNESTVVELADASLLHNMRSYREKDLRAVATSRDGGMTWSAVRDDSTLVEPVCQASILRYSWPENRERSRILFSNPAAKKRENMMVRVSYDEGRTWALGRTIHAGPAAYSCLAVLPDKSVGCLYERGEKSPYERIVIARFPLNWLEDGRATP
jgi:sialidase-1